MAVNPVAIGGALVGTVAVVGGGLYAGGVFSSGNKDGGGNSGNSVVLQEDGEVGMKDGHSLSADHDYSTSTNGYTNKYGSTHGKYLVGVAAKTQGTDANANDEGGEGVYEKRFPRDTTKKEELKDKFSTVTSATGASNSLKTVCQAAYKEELSSADSDGKKIVTTKPTNKDAEKFLEEHIGQFCSPAKQKIKAISDEGNGAEFAPTDDTVYGSKDAAKKDLVSAASTTSKGNKGFGYQKSKEFEQESGSDKPTISNNDVKAGCAEAYKKTAVEATNFTKTNVFKGCSMSGSAPS